MSGIFDKAQEGIKKMSEVPKGKTRAPSGRMYDRPTTPEGWRALEEAEARLSGAKAEGSSRKAVSAGVGKRANTERTVTRESREADAQSKRTQDAVHGFGPIKAAEEFFDNLLYPKKAKGKREGGDFFNPPQAKASEDENNPVSFLVGGAASVYDDATNQIPADAKIAMAPDSTVKERAGAVTNVALRTLNVAASVAPSIGVALKMSPKAVKGLIKAAKAGDVGAFQKIERALAQLPEGRGNVSVPQPSPDITIKGGPTAPRTIAEAVQMSEPGVEFRPRTDPKSGRTLTTEANLNEHLTQSIEELSPPKTIAEAVARVEEPPMTVDRYVEDYIAGKADTPEHVQFFSNNVDEVESAFLAKKGGLAEEPPVPPISEPQKTGLANQVQDAEAEAGVLKESPRAEGAKKGDAHAEGKRLVESGEIDPETLAREIATGKRTFKDESEVGALLEGKRRILQRVNQAKTKLDDLLEKGEDATDATAEYAKAQTDLQEFVDNVQQGKGKWSDVGRALQEGTDISEGQLVEVLAEYRRSGGKNPKIEKQLEDLIKQRDDLQVKLTEAEARAAKGKLGEDIKTRKAPAMKREELDAELDTLLKDISAASAKMSAGLDPEAFVVLGKIVANRVKYGAATVEELIISVKQVFKDRGLPEPDDTDILKAYAGESKPKTTRPPSMLAQAKRELALIEKRDALLEGVEKPSSPKAERVKSRRIQELEDEIAAIQAEAKNEDRVERTIKGSQARAERKANRPAELDKAYKEKLRAEIAEMEAGTYTPKGKAQRALDREAELLKAKRDLMKDQIRKAIDAGKPKNPFEVVNTVLNIPRSSMASMDVSYGGRQGWLGLFNDPGSWVKGWGDQSAAMFRGEDHAMAVYNATVRDNPNLAMYKKMKLHLNTPDGSLASGEEAMRGNILARVGWRKFNPWRSSDRGFNAFANTQRTGMADTFVNRAKKWKGAELTKEEYEQLGHTINTLTGRGGTSIEAFNKAAEFLSFGLFSPRFLASRIEMVSGVPMWGTLFRRNVSPQVKALVAKEWAQSMGGVATVVTGLYYGAQLAFKKENVRFVSDPTSTDFGKVIVKDPNSSKETRIDTAAGMLQPIVLASKFKQLKRMKADGKSVDLVNDYGESLEREAGKFFRSKLNPAFGMMWNLGTGKDMTGKEYDWKNAARDMTIPLTEKEMIEGLVEDGWNRSDALGFLNLIGITTNAYGNDKPKKGPSGPKGATKLPRPGQ